MDTLTNNVTVTLTEAEFHQLRRLMEAEITYAAHVRKYNPDYRMDVYDSIMRQAGEPYTSKGKYDAIRHVILDEQHEAEKEYNHEREED